MPDKLENPFKFWEELKRRKVIRVIVGYLAAAYVILELTSIVSEPLGLPDWTLNFVLVLLCIGFIIAIFFSWIYDFTSGGIKKTESHRAIKTKTEPTKPDKWKLKVSDIIILILLVIVIMLAYPRVFSNGVDIKANASTVTFINDLGKEETREVFDKESVYKILLFPFVAEKPDTNNTWLGYGIMEGVYKDLSQFPYMLNLKDYYATHHQEQVNSAKSKNCPYYVTGTYDIIDSKFNITYRIHQSVNGNIINERSYSSVDLFGIIDSISIIVRTDIGMADRLMDYTDIKTEDHITNNVDAYRYFIYGRYYRLLNNGFYDNINKALEYDSTFALASYYGARRDLDYQGNSVRAKEYIAHAMNNKGKFPDYMEMRTRFLNYLITEDFENSVETTELMKKLYPDNIDVLISLREVYYRNAMFVEAHEYIERLNELVPDNPEYQLMLATSYIYSNKLNKGLRYIKDRIKEKPGYVDFILRKVQFHLHRSEWDKAEVELNNAIFLSPEIKDNCAPLFDHIEYMREDQSRILNLEKFVGRYRRDNGEFSYDYFIMNNHLFGKAKNQYGNYLYPISDSILFDVPRFNIDFHPRKKTFSFNKEGEIYFMTSTHFYNPRYLNAYWKQDSLILKAEELLRNNSYQEALEAFQDAYQDNPEHYYLANYIKHIKFVQSDNYKIMSTQQDSYSGTFEAGWVMHEKNGDLYTTNSTSGGAFLMLPISEDEFMFPESYSYIFKFVKDNNSVSGFLMINLQDKEETFVKKIKS